MTGGRKPGKRGKGNAYWVESLEGRTLLSNAVNAALLQPLTATPSGAQVAGPADAPFYGIGAVITAQAGSSFDAEATVTNTMPYNFLSLNQPILSGSVLSQLILSNDSTLFNGPGLVGQITNSVYVPPLQSTFWTVPCTIPTWVKPGTYYLVEFLDLDDTNSPTGEYTQVNNVVTVTSGPIMSGLPQRVVATGQLTPSLPITNNTGQPYSGDESITYYLQDSANPVTPTTLGTTTESLNLQPGESVTQTTQVQLP